MGGGGVALVLPAVGGGGVALASLAVGVGGLASLAVGGGGEISVCDGLPSLQRSLCSCCHSSEPGSLALRSGCKKVWYPVDPDSRSGGMTAFSLCYIVTEVTVSPDYTILLVMTIWCYIL